MWLETRSPDQQTPFTGVAHKAAARGTLRPSDLPISDQIQELAPDRKVKPNGFWNSVIVAPQQQADKQKLALFDALAKAKILTSKVAMALDAGWRERFFTKLDLLHDLDDWEEGDIPVVAGSVHSFLRGSLSWRPRMPPALGLSPRGNIVAAWREGPDLRLSVEFFPDDLITFVIVWPDGEVVSRQAGNGKLFSFNRIVSPYPQAAWFDFA